MSFAGLGLCLSQVRLKPVKVVRKASLKVAVTWVAAMSGILVSASADTVQWRYVGHGGATTVFSLIPAYPSTTNFIKFIAPTDGKLYVNYCFAAVANGNPSLAVDPTNQTITVSFSPPLTNIACPAIAAPVSGVDGQFGPLRAGVWTFQVLQNSYTFAVTDAPIALTIESLAGGSAFELGWPLSGDTFQVLWASGLPATNWQVCTNPPTTLSNRNTLQLDAAPGNRFFRLLRTDP